MKIWLCWFQGEQDSSLSNRDKACIQRWREVAGEHDVVVLDQTSIDRILPDYNAILERCKHTRSLQHKADLLRLLLLNRFGGIWADTSVYPLASADEIISQTTATSDVFFYSFAGKRKSIQKGDRLIANWFMVATRPNHYVIQALCNEYTQRFLSAERWRYFEMHQAYCDLIDQDAKFRESIARMKLLPAESALVLGRKTMGVLKKEQIDCHNQPTLMVKKPSPISLALFPCIDPKAPVKTIIDTIIQLEKLQHSGDFQRVPTPLLDQTRRCLDQVDESEGVLKPAIKTKLNTLRQKLHALAQNESQKPKKIAYLHIGKCAGTTLYQYFKNKSKAEIDYLHMKRVALEDAEHYDFIFFIRHPISRFESAFNHTKRIVEFDTSALDINRLNHANSYSPKRIRRKMMRGGVAFSKQYDQLVRHFRSAEDLAQSLYCDDLQQRRKAQKLMRLPNEHLFKSIGWYLHNGDLVKHFSQNIKFIGCVETIDADLQIAKSQFNLNVDTETVMRKRSGLAGDHQPLSTTAIQNLQRWYRNSDYRALDLLHDHGLIKKNIYDYYQKAPSSGGLA